MTNLQAFPDNSSEDSLISAKDNRFMFNCIARRYDLINRIISLGMDRRWRRKAVTLLKPVDNERYLDVGCGTGDIGIEILHQAPGATIVGIDPAAQMLEIANSRLLDLGINNSITLQVGDSMDLPFDDDVFDGVISAFCIRNVTHRIRAMAEMRRVLKKNRPMVILELTVPENRLIRICYRIFNRIITMPVGRFLTNKKAYSYLVKSIEYFPRCEEVTEMIKAAGFNQIRYIYLCFGTVTIFYATCKHEPGLCI